MTPIDISYAYMYYVCMPTVLMVKNLIFIIHTRDHGHPHVTVYLGNPEMHEAKAKIRLDLVEVIESKGFSEKALTRILNLTLEHQLAWKEKWDESREG